MTLAGRTAPAFLQDLTLYTPWSPDVPNLLAESPLIFSQSQHLGENVPLGSCRHRFSLKPRQSRLPELDERPGPETVWTVAAFCSSCRLHLHLKVDYTVRFEDRPCPTPDHPLHHLVRYELQEPLEKNAWRQQIGSTAEIYTYRCSALRCSVLVTVRVTPPVLRPYDVQVLTDPGLLRQRTDDAFRKQEGSTEGMKYPNPTDVLCDLRSYLKNSWRAKQDPKYASINVSNKRFIVRFGPGGVACKDVLEHLGFRSEAGETWKVPEPDPDEAQPFQGWNNMFIDDAEHEIISLLLSRPYDERQSLPDLPAPVAADRELSRVLGCQDYDKHPSSRTAKQIAEMRTGPFVALGCPSDLSDDLISKAYHWQVQTDPQNTPTYLSNLRYIANDRQSDLLETEVALQISQGHFEIESLNQAYKALQLTGREALVTDEDVIGCFNATLTDSPAHEHQLREYLRMIGVHRNSKRIYDTAQNVMETYGQALAFLDASPTTDDEGIRTMFTVKTNDNKNVEERAIKALRIIAKERQSQLLTTWIESGFTIEPSMEPAEGYQALQIDNREVDDEMILMQYKFTVDENPASADFYTRALTAIATARGSTVLMDHLHSKAPQDPEGALDEPVGLENIGNTCYLNSLLQVLFTTVDLRNIVLNFDEYKMPLDDVSLRQKRVGQRQVSLKEVQTGQKFVDSLATLFRGMIQTPQSSIKPEQELARLTLESHSVKEKLRRRSTLKTGERPSLSETHSLPFLGPLSSAEYDKSDVGDTILLSPAEEVDIRSLPPNDANDHDNHEKELGAKDVHMNDNSSEATVVSKEESEPVLTEDDPEAERQAITDDKENLAPIPEGDLVKSSVSTQNQSNAPLTPASPSKLNSQAGTLQVSIATENATKEQPMQYLPPPGKPPPVPPRKPLEATTITLEEYARQQDVTEVIGHVLNQLSSAIRPTGFDKTGEQLDEVHDTFYGQLILHTENDNGSPGKSEQYRDIITRVFHQPADVYAAIDNEFDLQTGGNAVKGYISLSSLPPILCVQLDRVAWNNQTKRQEKLNHHVEVPETIYMDRYLESGPDSELMQRRRHTWDLKRELATISRRRGVLEEKHGQSKDIPTLLEDAKTALEYLAEVPADTFGGDLDVDPNTIATLGALADSTRTELEDLRVRATDISQQIKEAFVDMRKHPYRLHAAFFHRGSAGGGHYWVYIYDHQKEIWRKYNDDHVTVVQNRNEIFGKPPQDSYNVPPNPYLLVYVRSDRVGEVVETVKRDIVYPPPDAPPPVPARTQMAEMPPVMAQEDVKMTGHMDVKGGEQIPQAEPDPAEFTIGQPQQPVASGWNKEELTVPRRVQW
ncbi:hypothetical protein, variant 1 [Exophiala mesophila]|uniref:ubiquitinyl hydrolase 1 n=1 Tax=Exophiala mesophila TaxID=212818 RepID=A0A0D1ZLR4_EXOME|nr:hypothetical protein, variant 1 [Exophiala mesophila]KIV95527.1 hypothetical protein, variant 1 [Exophiala mesophila]